MMGGKPRIGKNLTLERLMGFDMGIQVSSIPQKAHGRAEAGEKTEIASYRSYCLR